MPHPPILWTPTREWCERTSLARYTAWLEQRGIGPFADYHDLWHWSVTDLEGFWTSIWEYFEIRSETPYAQVLDSHSMPGAKWFSGAELNYAERVFDAKPDGSVAIVAASETGSPRELVWHELRAKTAAVAAGLRRLGVVPGDRVAAYTGNTPETVIAFLACASVGAIWSSCSPEFGVPSVIDRFGQITPKVLFATPEYQYGGRLFNRRDDIRRIQERISSIEHVILLPGPAGQESAPEWPIATNWTTLLETGGDARLEFTRLPFDHPLWIVYSSGTTGLPKPIVHGHGGMLLEHLKTLSFHVDAKEGDRIFWFTTTGWMMWNFLVGALLTDAAIVLYDGSPGFPEVDALWRLAADVGITCFGTSAAYINTCLKAGVEPTHGRDLSRLRAVGSTGSPLSPEGFRWVYERIGASVWLFSMSGGTDVCTAFVGGVPTLPVYEGELQARSLGASVKAFDEGARAVIDEMGELVLTEPLPSMPLFFWGDDGSRLADSYFDVFPAVWRHGDWVTITSRGTAIIHGRSDSTINRGGIRIGTSEIYRAVMHVPEVMDALVVDVQQPDRDDWMPLFVVLRDGAVLDVSLVEAIKAGIRTSCSPRHVPTEVLEVAEIPRTLSGKAIEIPIKRILLGAEPSAVVSRDSLRDPGVLDYFVRLRLDRDRAEAEGTPPRG